jgi:hypothetical protein
MALLPAFWLLLRATARQQQIRPAQLWRVTVYVSDVLPIALFAIGILLYVVAIGFNAPTAVLLPLVMLSPLALLAWISVRLSTALRRYLQLEKAGQILAAFVTIFGLLFIVVLLNTSASFGFTLLASR